MDPWSDVALSLDPATWDRHGYGRGNPVGFSDPGGHVSGVEADGDTFCLGYCPIDSDDTQRPAGTTVPSTGGGNSGQQPGSTAGPSSTLANRGVHATSGPVRTGGGGPRHNATVAFRFVKGVGANARDSAADSYRMVVESCQIDASMFCTSGMTQLMGHATSNCVHNTGIRGCAGRVYNAGSNYLANCNNALKTGDAYALGKGCGGDAIFTLLGGIGIEKLAAKGGVRAVASDAVALCAKSCGETAATRLGRQVHRDWDYGPGYVKEYRLPSGRRVDALNEDTMHIYELKPNNPRAIREGYRQLQRYLDELGPGWTGDVITY